MNKPITAEEAKTVWRDADKALAIDQTMQEQVTRNLVADAQEKCASMSDDEVKKFDLL